MPRVPATLLSCSLIAAAAMASPSTKPAADLILTRARVWTGEAARPECEALAVIGERIVATGTNAEIDAWRGPSTRTIDAGGRRVVPGFNDAHLHFVRGGMQLDQVALKDALSIAEVVRLIGARTRTIPPGEWLLGGDWDETQWTPAKLPDRSTIDAASPDHPVFLTRYDGHMGLANSLAIRLAGVSRETRDPPGGVIVRDAQGEPSGLFKDSAMRLVGRVIPPPTRDQRQAAARRALREAARLGVTSVQDMFSPYEDISVYAELLERGELTARIYAAPPVASWEDLARVGLRRGFGSPWLRIGALKGYADGSLGSRTASFFEPFLDAAEERGLLADELQPLEATRARWTAADAAGLQLCMHAIGDRAISTVLDLFGDVARVNGQRDRRLRIEHAQHMGARDFDRFAALGVIASVQPYHAIDDGRWAEARIGAERARRTYAFRTLLEHGVRLAFGTDWNVVPLDPLQTVYAAVTRATLDGKRPGGWIPEQKLTVAEAIEAYTLGSAYAEFQEREKGTLAPGKLADFVILSGDVFTIDPAQIRNVTVTTTVVGGRVVWP